MGKVAAISKAEELYPAGIRSRIHCAPEALYALGDTDILGHRFTALLCSSECPGRLVSKTYDLAQRLRSEGRAVIGGFDTPMEQESLRILLQSPNPVVIFLARGLGKLRLQPGWERAIGDGRLLLLSALHDDVRRVTRKQARLRNLYVAAMAEEVLIAHAADGSPVSDVASTVLGWQMPLYTLDDEANFLLQFLGASSFSL